jgi:[acyl-carrier-protein] S-malonyltransferase
MGKIAFIYPGQGAQKIGMGKDFYENGELAKNVYNMANEVLDFDVKKICFEENDLIDNTAYTQAALVTTCLAMTEEIKNLGVKPDVTAGLSLGEYAAIAVADGMDNRDAIATVRARGIYMNEAVPSGEGTMAAILGLSGEEVYEVIKEREEVMIANYNCPEQIVITGKKQSVLDACDDLLASGAKRAIELKVSGPFHSTYLKNAGAQLRKKLEEVEWKPLSIPYVTNVTAEYVKDIKDTKALLEKQVSSSVMWEQSVRKMIADGVDIFVEIGSGRTLAGFIRKIDRNVKVINVGNFEDLEKLKEQLC